MRNDPISEDDHDGRDDSHGEYDDDHDPDWDDLESADEPETVTCPHCGAETDDESILCPICQRRLAPAKPVGRSFVLALVLILIVLFLWPFLGWVFRPN